MAAHARGRGRLRGRVTAAGAKTMTDAPLFPVLEDLERGDNAQELEEAGGDWDTL